ncbi:MAG: quinone-dependent dihydroorotate dehydrogenase [Gammaproteobacteria bacterium]|nr:quinone-dependent dihydroorotate dehydrogenase [Gammaproteobacteria bacterium]
MYKFFCPLLFCLPPEVAHAITLNLLKFATVLKLTHFFVCKSTGQPINLLDLQFKNRIGIAAGLDKNGDYLDALAALGVGFIEVGAVTPKAQIGNSKPRLFRLVKEQALINRMGFNNKGVDYLVNKLKQRKSTCIVGVNFGKNKETPLAQAADDYIYCLEKVFLYADFCTINISSPNTPDLQQLQTPLYLENLLTAIKKKRDDLTIQHTKKLPLLVKISPDLIDAELYALVDMVDKLGLDGIIATNTTNQRSNVTNHSLAKQIGGLSGKPIARLSYEMLVKIRQHNKHLPVISVGGISSVADAKQRFQAGADLIQLYTGLIYEGPRLLRKLIEL